MTRRKDMLTTGQVAKICRVAPRTVVKWFDSGQLRGYRIPGTKERRIPVGRLIRFMRAHGFPLEGIETGMTRILIVDDQFDVIALLTEALEHARYEVRSASNAFEAGAVAKKFRPHVILASVDLPILSDPTFVRMTRAMPDLAAVRLVAVTGAVQDHQEHTLRERGFDAVLCKPFDVSQVVRTIEAVLPGGD